jgi:hypothetical protein
VRQAQLIGLHLGAGGVQARQCGLLLRQVLIDLLRTERAGGLNLAGAIGIGLGLCQLRFGLDGGGLGLCQLRIGGVAGDARKHLALFHHVADVHQHVREPIAADLRADDRFLPGDDVAVGRHDLRPLHGLGCDQIDGECRASTGLFRRAFVVACALAVLRNRHHGADAKRSNQCHGRDAQPW